MMKFISKLKTILYILRCKIPYGILIFTHIPTVGDTITVGEMIATFKKNV